MIKRLCGLLLSVAARRWPARLRDEMLTEWRAELHATPGTLRRWRYAASLATSRPHRQPALVAAPGRNPAHAVLSFLLIAGLPAAYLPFAVSWTSAYSVDTIAWQTWAAAASIVAAVVLGLGCARLTTGVTQLIRPTFVPLWTIGIALAVLLVWPLAEGRLPDRATVIDLSCWALSAVVLCTLAARVALSGRAVLSWAVVVVAGAVAFWFANMHNHLSHFSALGMEYFFDGRFLTAYVFVVAVQPLLHVNVFLLVYTHHLVRRHRPAEKAVPSQPATA
ncbi:hypothetical protein [Catellatospora sp. NPDC049609]|uniref:hypothetical protein n=1 Tax=Catellatospora sp. NPDC049609 TaxID=3155505 RepID=UPI0034256DF4